MHIRKIAIRFAGVSAAAVIFTALAGCATPHVVDEIKVSDRDLSCDSLKIEMRKAAKYREQADEWDAASDDLFVSGLFAPPIWALLPATLARDAASNSNAAEAKQAANKRIAHLQKLQTEKCGG